MSSKVCHRAIHTYTWACTYIAYTYNTQRIPHIYAIGKASRFFMLLKMHICTQMTYPYILPACTYCTQCKSTTTHIPVPYSPTPHIIQSKNTVDTTIYTQNCNSYISQAEQREPKG